MTEQSKPYSAKSQPRDVKLPWKYLKTSAAAQRQFTATIPEGHTKEDYMRPSYWDVVSKQFERYTILRVIAEDDAFYGEYLVTDCSHQHATLVELKFIQLDVVATEPPVTDEYEYKWKGPTLRHCVIRVADGEIVAREMASKPDCLQWIAAKAASKAA